MPWKEQRAMGLKIDFVERAEKGEKIAALCREFGISRTSGHKWLKRYRELGHRGLDEESKRPKSAPLATAEDLVMAILEARDAHPRWGPRKLEVVLKRRFGATTPSERTIARVLRRANKVRKRRKRAVVDVVDHAPRVVATACNDVWTVDFKGYWRARDGSRCDPLTVRDACSRFVLAIDLCRATTEAVREIFERLFTKYGVPSAIQSDNGVPFVSVKARGGISTLSAWWMSLGIRILRSRPGCPQDNGGHERMHADVAADVEERPQTTAEAQQRALARWRQEFNHVRPHDALSGKTPAEVYVVKERRKPCVLAFAYPRHYAVRRVSTAGMVKLAGEKYFVSGSLAGHYVGIETADSLRSRVWFRDLDLGPIELLSPNVIDDVAGSTNRRRPARSKPVAA
jgi:transposase InsO family protein